MRKFQIWFYALKTRNFMRKFQIWFYVLRKQRNFYRKSHVWFLVLKKQNKKFFNHVKIKSDDAQNLQSVKCPCVQRLEVLKNKR